MNTSTSRIDEDTAATVANAVLISLALVAAAAVTLGVITVASILFKFSADAAVHVFYGVVALAMALPALAVGAQVARTAPARRR